jgi:hypothetical protein
MSEIRRGGPRGKAVLAGLPHVLFPLVEAIAPIARDLKSVRINEHAAMLAFAGVIVVMLIFARRRHWPRWAASWIGYGLVVPWIAPFWLFSRVPTALEGVLPFAQILFSFGVGFALAGRDRLGGLLVALPSVPMCWCWVDSVAAHSAISLPLFIGAGLATGLAAVAILRWEHKQVGIRLALLVNLLTRVPFTYARRYHHDYLPPPLPPSTPGAVAASVRDVVIGAILVTGPLWGWALWDRGRRLIARSVRRWAGECWSLAGGLWRRGGSCGAWAIGMPRRSLRGWHHTPESCWLTTKRPSRPTWPPFWKGRASP